MRFAQRVFFVAGIYGVLVLSPQFFNEGWIARHDPPAITHPEHFYGFTATAWAFQVLFLLMSRDPVRYRPLMPVAMLEKFGFAAVAAVLFALGRVSALVFGFGMLDLVLGVLFVAAYVRTPSGFDTVSARAG
jgi:hypothetical protein